ncbi:MAG: M20/M25/M40 family metallo-hydrolase [Planctomycetota bacterium]|nr:M20/M25/M40 family metallo-hydrolase [Planctomycetota bacterium]
MSRLPAPTRLLSELVSIASPSGGEAQVADHLLELCSAAGLDAERPGRPDRNDGGVLIAIGSGRPHLLLNSHLDTVPVGEGWSGDPLDGTWREGRLTARGASDAKASVAAMLHAAGDFATGERPPGTLLVAFTTHEETTNAGMAALLDHLRARDLSPDGAVTGEPTGLEVVRAQAGLVVIEATWTGRSCHAAHVARVEHANALLAATKELARLPSWIELPGQHPLLGRSTLVPTMLVAGESHNKIPDRAQAVFDGRVVPPHDADACLAVLAGHLPSAELFVRSDRLKAVETPEDHPLVRAALDAAGRDRAVGSSTMSDMALLADVPAVKCGPGETARSHTPDEFLLERELRAGCETYRALIPKALAALKP